MGLVCDPKTFRPVDHSGVRWLDTERDYPLAAEFWPREIGLSLQDWQDARNQGYRYCAIVEGGRIVSLGAVWKYSRDRWEVAAIRTAPEFRGRGYAKRIVSFVTEHILASGRVPTCTVSAENVAMIRVVESVGFRKG